MLQLSTPNHEPRYNIYRNTTEGHTMKRRNTTTIIAEPYAIYYTQANTADFAELVNSTTQFVHVFDPAEPASDPGLYINKNRIARFYPSVDLIDSMPANTPGDDE